MLNITGDGAYLCLYSDTYNEWKNEHPVSERFHVIAVQLGQQESQKNNRLRKHQMYINIVRF